MICAVDRVDDNGVYFLFTEGDYAVEEFWTHADLAAQGYDGTNESLMPLLSLRLTVRSEDKTNRDLAVSVLPPPPPVGLTFNSDDA